MRERRAGRSHPRDRGIDRTGAPIRAVRPLYPDREAAKEARAVADVVEGWRRHFADCGVTEGDIALYAQHIDRPFLLEQRRATG